MRNTSPFPSLVVRLLSMLLGGPLQLCGSHLFPCAFRRPSGPLHHLMRYFSTGKSIKGEGNQVTRQPLVSASQGSCWRDNLQEMHGSEKYQEWLSFGFTFCLGQKPVHRSVPYLKQASQHSKDSKETSYGRYLPVSVNKNVPACYSVSGSEKYGPLNSSGLSIWAKGKNCSWGEATALMAPSTFAVCDEFLDGGSQNKTGDSDVWWCMLPIILDNILYSLISILIFDHIRSWMEEFRRSMAHTYRTLAV